MKVVNNQDSHALESMVFIFRILQFRNIPVKETVQFGLKSLKELYKVSSDIRYIELALLLMKASTEFANTSDLEHKDMNNILAVGNEMSALDIFPKRRYIETIKLTKPQVRKMIGKWMPSRNNPMTINQLVEDIISKVRERERGIHNYEYTRFGCGTGKSSTERYALIIGEKESFFYNEKNMIYYKFCFEVRGDKC